PVAADDAQDLPGPDVERHVPERPDGARFAARTGAAGPPPEPGPRPAGGVGDRLPQRPVARGRQLAEAVVLRQVLDAAGGGHGGSPPQGGALQAPAAAEPGAARPAAGTGGAA